MKNKPLTPWQELLTKDEAKEVATLFKRRDEEKPYSMEYMYCMGMLGRIRNRAMMRRRYEKKR